MEIWQYLVLFAAGASGGLLSLFHRGDNSEKWLHILVSFSGAYLLGVTVLHLLPDIYHFHFENTGLYILIGFFIQIILAQLSRGIEHGHIHVHENPRGLGYVFSVFMALSVHSFLEGMPLVEDSVLGHKVNHFLFGIVFHKVPAAFALMAILLTSPLKRPVVYLLLFSFAAMSPLGAAFSNLMASEMTFGPSTMGILFALVIGSFLHILSLIHI